MIGLGFQPRFPTHQPIVRSMYERPRASRTREPSAATTTTSSGGLERPRNLRSLRSFSSICRFAMTANRASPGLLQELLDARLELVAAIDHPLLARVVALHAARGAVELEAVVHALLAARARLDGQRLAVAGLREQRANLVARLLEPERLELALP